MPNNNGDDEYNQALSTMAGKLEELEDKLDEAERDSLNVSAQARGLIDQGEDLIDEYRGTGIGAARGVQSWADGNKSSIDDITKLLDDIEDHIDNDDEDSGLGRREYLKLGTGVGATAFAGGALGSYLLGAFGGGNGNSASQPQGFSPGELNNWDSVEKCLSSEQEGSVTEVVERYDSKSRNDLRYSVETDGNVIIHEPDEDGYRPIAETTDNDFMCEINY